jgi:hypothetical protein
VSASVFLDGLFLVKGWSCPWLAKNPHYTHNPGGKIDALVRPAALGEPPAPCIQRISVKRTSFVAS